MKYYIRWTSKLTDASGFGTGMFSKSEADKIVKTLNEKKDNVCIHEAVPANEKQEDNLSE